MRATTTINLDGTPRTVSADLWRLWLVPGDAGVPIRVDVDPHAPLQWRSLDALEALIELRYHGHDVGFLEYLAARTGLHRAGWSGHAAATIDLSRTSLREFSFDARPGEIEVVAPTAGTLEVLQVHAEGLPNVCRVHVRDPRQGAALAVECWGASGEQVEIAGLPALRSFATFGPREIRLSPRIAAHPRLEALSLRHTSACGIADVAALAGLPGLRRLRLQNTFGADLRELPPRDALPELTELEIDGLRERDAAAVRAWARGLARVSIRGARSAAWLRAHADDPFREWAEDISPRAGKAASKAWRQACAAIDGLGPAPTPAEAQALLHAFVAAFNALNERDDLDTIQREEVAAAFDALRGRLADAVSDEQARAWFDDWRDF